MTRLLCFVVSLGIVLQTVLSEVHSNQDSYLNALKTSQHINNVEDREDFDYSYHPDMNQGYDYHPAQPHYGPPAYGPPKPVYGPPPPIYGPPHPPIPIYYHHHHPRDNWFLDKFKFKLDLLTIGKLLLKLILFKKIIKFIALICLLLFLPKLKDLIKDDEEDSGSGESRQFATDKDKLHKRINEISKIAFTAFDTFSRKYDGCERDQIWCRFQRTIDAVDSKYPYEKIVKLYLPDNEVTNTQLPVDDK